MAFHRTRSLSPLLSPSVREGKSRRMEKEQISPPPPLSLTHKLLDKMVGHTKMCLFVHRTVNKASVYLQLQARLHETEISITIVLVADMYTVSQIYLPNDSLCGCLHWYLMCSFHKATYPFSYTIKPFSSQQLVSMLTLQTSDWPDHLSFCNLP